MVNKETGKSDREGLRLGVQNAFLREDQPLEAQEEELRHALSLLYNQARSLITPTEFPGASLTTNVRSHALEQAGFVDAQVHLTEQDRTSITFSFHPEDPSTLFINEHYFRRETLLREKKVDIDPHRDMEKVFVVKVKGGSNGALSILTLEFRSPRVRFTIFPKSETLPPVYRELAKQQPNGRKAIQATVDRPTDYLVREITAKDINRLLFITFSGLYDIQLRPPSSPIQEAI